MKFVSLFLSLLPKILAAVSEAQAVHDDPANRRQHVLNTVSAGVSIADDTGKVHIDGVTATALASEIMDSVDKVKAIVDAQKVPQGSPGTVQ